VDISPRLIKRLNTKLKWNNYIPHAPTERQLAALLCNDVQELMYGGAGGGGKTDLLLMFALQYVDAPGYAALLLMRTTADLKLPGALIDRSQEWLGGTDAKWKEQDKQWVFPSGATLNFGYLEHENDKYRYKSSEFQFIGFDELTQFAETQYVYLFTRLRRLMGYPVPLRVRSGTNPDGPGYEWVKQRFIIEGLANGRIYIPARLSDNPYLDKDAYTHSLMNLDPITRKRIMDGDWSVRPGGKKFKREWFEIVDDVPLGLRIVRYWDMAGTEPKPGKDPDYMAGAKVGVSPEGIYYILDMRRLRASPLEGENLIKRTALIDGVAVSIRMEQEGGDSGKRVIDYYTRIVLQGYDFRGHRPTGPKEVRANPVSSQAEAGNVKLLRGEWINDFLDEAVAFPTTGVHDDQIDALSGAIAVLADGSGFYEEQPPYAEGVFDFG